MERARSSLYTSHSSMHLSTIDRLPQTQKDLPAQLLSSTEPLDASLVIASFGSAKPYNVKAFDLAVEVDSGSPLPASEKPLRYGKLPQIHHIFKSDPNSPPKIITLIFTAAVIAALPVLLGAVSKFVARPMFLLMKFCVVDLTGRKSQSFLQSFQQLANPTRPILLLDPGYRGGVFHVLHILELVPNITTSFWHRIGKLSQRKQSAARGTRTKACRPAVR